MDKLRMEDLWKLEDYAEKRAAFRDRVLAHKRSRTVALGPHMTLLFEDRLTIQYQVQKMLRIERLFEKAAIQDELDAYNPLVPDGSNWKATHLIEFPDKEERERKLVELRGVEHHIWVQVGEHQRVSAIADEDLDRSNDTKTSAVHFLRFELTPDMIAAARAGAAITVGVDHPAYSQSVTLTEPVRASLAQDLHDA